MHVLETNDAAAHKEFGLFFTKMLPLIVMVPQIASCDQVGDEIQILVVLEGVEHVDEEGMVELAEQLAFVHDAVDALLLHDDALGHLFDGVLRLELLALHLPHLAEPAFAHHADELEMVLVDGFELDQPKYLTYIVLLRSDPSCSCNYPFYEILI